MSSGSQRRSAHCCSQSAAWRAGGVPSGLRSYRMGGFFSCTLPVGKPGEIHVGSLDSQETRLVTQAYSRALYSESGHLLFVREGDLVAQTFDLRTLSVSGAPTVVAENVLQASTISVRPTSPCRARASWPTSPAARRRGWSGFDAMARTPGSLVSRPITSS